MSSLREEETVLHPKCNPQNLAFSYCSWGSQGKKTELVRHSLLQWTTFCQNSTMTHPSWVALHSMAHSFIELDTAVVHVTRLVSFLWLWFSVCLPFDGEGQEAYGSFLMGQTDWGGTGSCSDGRGHAQYIFNPSFCWWAGLCSLPVIWPEAKLWWR